MIINPKHLKFPLEIKTFGQKKKVTYYPGFLHRRAARKIAAYMINYEVASYQFFDEKERKLFQGNKWDMAHWILHGAGYICCVSDLLRLAGIDPKTELHVDKKLGSFVEPH